MDPYVGEYKIDIIKAKIITKLETFKNIIFSVYIFFFFILFPKQIKYDSDVIVPTETFQIFDLQLHDLKEFC